MTDVNTILGERKTTHGDYTHNARVAQQIMRVLETGPSWSDLNDTQRESLHMFAHKMARIVGGDPNVHDHWDDIAGYAKITSDRIPRAAAPPPAADVRVDVRASAGGPLPVVNERLVPRGRLEPLGPMPGGEDPLRRPDVDGSQHASLTPWAVSTQWRYRHDMQVGGKRQAAFDACWRQVGPGTWALEPVLHALPPGECLSLYANTRNTWVLRLEHCPPDARAWFPVLRRELNQVEYDAVDERYRPLYEWSDERDSAGAWTLLSQHEAWARGAEE